MESRIKLRALVPAAKSGLVPESKPANAATTDFAPYFIAAVIAVLLNIVVPATLLDFIGIPYDTLGGNPLLKFHPGTYISIITLFLFYKNFPEKRAELFSFTGPWRLMVSIVFCLIIGTLGNNRTGLAAYIENFFPPVAICLLLSMATVRDRQLAAYWMVAFFSLNIVVALIESMMGVRLIPTVLTVSEAEGEFRASGLSDHPLTGASMTMMSLFLLLSMKWPAKYTLPMMLLHFAGLLAFSGRTALVTSALLLIVWALGLAYSKIKEGTFTLGNAAVGVVVSVVLPGFLVLLLSATTLGQRMVAHLYWDESAQVRNTQWLILSRMSLSQLLFGMDIDTLTTYIWQIGLLFPFNDIENFWLLIFCNLGAVGFIFFLYGFLSFLWWLWEVGSLTGRLLLIGMILVLTSSNSIGRKSNMLTLLAPAVLCTGAFGRRADEEGEARTLSAAPAVTSNWRQRAVVPEQAVAIRRLAVAQPPRLRSTPGSTAE